MTKATPSSACWVTPNGTPASASVASAVANAFPHLYKNNVTYIFFHIVLLKIILMLNRHVTPGFAIALA